MSHNVYVKVEFYLLFCTMEINSESEYVINRI